MTSDLEAPRSTVALPDSELLRFPPGFLWGAATSAYQVEGAVDVDGRGPSTWDTFCRMPMKVHNGDTGDHGADHYRRYAQDVDLMSSLHLSAYRFSVSWPRVQPDGRGAINQRGLDFYDRLVDRLLARGITPFVTLHHWDLPQALQDLGGWDNRNTAVLFAHYADTVYQRLADRVRNWTTLNEPWCQAFQGHAAGTHAPGLTDPGMAVRALHHLLLGHGLAVQSMRAHQRPGHEFSIALNVEPVNPADPGDPADRDAARRVDGLLNRMFLDPVFYGRYPEDVRRDLAGVSDFSFVVDSDFTHITTPLDALCVNYYRRQVVAGPGPDGGTRAGPMWPGSEDVRFVRQGQPLTGLGWEIDPTGLHELLVELGRSYPRLPMYVTENGAAFDDVVSPGERVHDPDRLRYIDGHLRAAHSAIASGADLRGYFVWSLLDNFEWHSGYAKRFGIVYVDFGTQTRIVKDSGWWYRGVAERNGLRG